MESEIRKIQMESVNGLEKKVDKFEKILTPHQQEFDKLKKIKTEEAINYSENQRVAHLEKDIVEEACLEGIQVLEEEIKELKLHLLMDKETIKEIMHKKAEADQMVEELSRKLSACEDAKKMSDRIQEDMKRRELENVRDVEDLRRKNLEASRNVEELRCRLLAYEEEKKTASRVHEEMMLRELENIRCVKDLRRQNLEANRQVEELRSRVLSFEEDKKTVNLIMEEMKIRETENFRCLADLRQKNSEADRKMKELGDIVLNRVESESRQKLEASRNVEELRYRLLAYEEEKKTARRVHEEMILRELENIRCVKDLRRQNLEANRKVDELRSRVLAFEEDKKTVNLIMEEMKIRETENFRCLTDLRQKNSEADRKMEELGDRVLNRVESESLQKLRRKDLEASRNVEELRYRLLAYEEEKKTARRVHEEMILKELENIRCVEDLRRQNLEANRKVDELRSRVLAFEEDKKTVNLIMEEMKIRETENFRCLADMRQKNSEADRKMEELGDRVSTLEEEKRTAVRDRDGLERQKLEAEKRMNEMKDRESDLKRQILEADDRVKEMKGRSLGACKAAEVNIKRFRNVLPITEELCKLLKMNVEDLVSVKDKFVWGADEEGLNSSSVVSGDSRNGATTTNGVAGPHERNKAVEELTVSANEQPTKKRKRKRIQRAVRVNKSLIKRKWMLGADMVRAFEEDDELCLHAVCALYRQHVSSSQSTESSNKQFYHFEALRGSALADYLINNDPELSLMIPVDEVKQQYPDIMNQCRSLAICYSSYFTAKPRTNEPLARSLTLVCCHRYVPPHTHVGPCGTCCGVGDSGEGEVIEL